MIALTFDDGPFLWTNDILDVLEERKVKATFFIAGNNRGKGHIDDSSYNWSSMLRKMYAAGHHIASHTWTHRNLNEMNSTIRRSEVIFNEMALRNIFGWIPTYIRPPYLECNEQSGCLALMKELGYHVVNSNIDTKDFEFANPELIQAAKDRFDAGVSSPAADNKYIVLAHDVHEQTAKNLTAHMIDTALERGYKLVTVGECLGDAQENWYRTAPKGYDSIPTQKPSTTAKGSSSTKTATATKIPKPTTVKISPNQSCGGDTGYTCQGSRFGKCCSWYGFW